MFCPILTRDSLDALLAGQLTGSALATLRAHLAQPCDACLDWLEGEELTSFLERACGGEVERKLAELGSFSRNFVVNVDGNERFLSLSPMPVSSRASKATSPPLAPSLRLSPEEGSVRVSDLKDERVENPADLVSKGKS